MKILALDISTSCTGWSLFEDGKLLQAGAIETPTAKPTKTVKTKSKKIKIEFKTLFEKMDYVVEKLSRIINQTNNNIDFIVAEAAFKKFAQGKSSADVIAKLIGFNFCLVYTLCNHHNIKEKFIDVKTARKSVGLTIPRGADTKKLVYKFVKPLFPQLDWPEKKTGNPQDWTIDMADALVIGMSAMGLNNLALDD